MNSLRYVKFHSVTILHLKDTNYCSILSECKLAVF